MRTDAISRPATLFRSLLGSCLLLLIVPPAYFVAALVGALVPANPGWDQARRGITIFVESNGVHTWIVMPETTKEMDWRPLVPSSHIRDASLGGDYVAIGYGNREFYLNTPAWSDLTVGRALGAAFGTGPSLLHVYHEPRPEVDGDHRAITLTSDEYRRLATVLASSFERDDAGRTIPLIGRGYGPTDVFYEGRGQYDVFYTCNEWAGAALRASGVRVGIWTPFTQAIMRRY